MFILQITDTLNFLKIATLHGVFGLQRVHVASFFLAAFMLVL